MQKLGKSRSGFPDLVFLIQPRMNPVFDRVPANRFFIATQTERLSSSQFNRSNQLVDPSLKAQRKSGMHRVYLVNRELRIAKWCFLVHLHNNALKFLLFFYDTLNIASQSLININSSTRTP